MEISMIVQIRTPFGEMGLVPQDRNLLEESSVAPLQFAAVRIHLWSLLERIHGTWGISGLVEPAVHQINSPGYTLSIADESIAAKLMKSVTLLAGEWAAGHPEAFEYAAAEAFEFDREGLYRELGALRESLTRSARAIESITSEAPSKNSARLREYSKKDAAHVIRTAGNADDHAGNLVSGRRSKQADRPAAPSVPRYASR
jgi:hypothetical protein